MGPVNLASPSGFCPTRIRIYSRRLASSAALLLLSLSLGGLLPSHAQAQTLQLSPSDILKRGSADAPSSIQIDRPAPAEQKPAAPAAALTVPAAEEKPPAAEVPDATPFLCQGYLYIEPYQARFEVLFNAQMMLEWLSPESAKVENLTPAIQKALLEKAAPLVGNWCHIRVDNEKVEGRFLGGTVVKGVPGRTDPIKPGETLPKSEAMIGFIWVFPTSPAPGEVQVEWSGLVQGITTMNIRTFFGVLSEPMKVTTAVPKTTWRNLNRLARPAPLAAVPSIDTPPPLRVPIAAVVWFLGGLAFYITIKIKDYWLPGGSVPYFVTWLLGAVLMTPLLVVRVPRPGTAAVPAVTTTSDAERILAPLLRNVYGAFDHRDESEVYDILARSASGELLRKLYLETITALSLDGREETRVVILDFTANVTEVERKGQGFIATCQWSTQGIVGHWGHSHTRVTRYTAKITVQPVQSSWKITQFDVQEAYRS